MTYSLFPFAAKISITFSSERSEILLIWERFIPFSWQNSSNLKHLLIFDVSNVKGMIISFGDKETEKIWNGLVSRKLPREIQETARRKLRMINNSIDIDDLRIPPANRLEKLKRDLKEFYSIRINNQWRIIFKWEIGNAFEVIIVDYH